MMEYSLTYIQTPVKESFITIIITALLETFRAPPCSTGMGVKSTTDEDNKEKSSDKTKGIPTRALFLMMILRQRYITEQQSLVVLHHDDETG